MRETADDGGIIADEVQIMKAKCLSRHEVLEDPNAHEQAVEVAGTAAIQETVAASQTTITTTGTSIGITGGIGRMS